MIRLDMGERIQSGAIPGARWLVLAAVQIAALFLAIPSVWAQSVAMVTDVSGRVTGAAPVTILSEIAVDARLHLGAGSRIVAIYLKSGDEYTLNGPAQVQFRTDEPLVTDGAKPQKKVNPLRKGGNMMIKPVGVAQAAFVMRGGRPSARIQLLTLSDTRTLETAPEFRWQEIEPELTYRFDIIDEAGRTLHESDVRGASFRLPSAVRLRPGVGYTWEVSARASDGRRYVGAGDFSIAADDLRAQAKALRPAVDAPVSDRVVYAVWLEQESLKDEARRFWQALASERPGHEKLKALAR